MEHLFQTALTFRGALVKLVENLDDEMLDSVPQNFNNNIRWNLAHLIVTPALLTYQLVGTNSPLIGPEFISSAKKGTNHENFNLGEEYGIKHLSEILIETIKQLQRDYEDLSHRDFKAYETSTGFVIKDLQSAIAYSNIHDGIHLGVISSIKKVLDSQ